MLLPAHRYPSAVLAGVAALAADACHGGGRRRIKNRACRGCRDLLDGVQIIQNPDSPPVRRQNEIVVPRVNHQVVERCGREIRLPFRPRSAAINRHKEPNLGAEIQDVRVLGILLDSPQHTALGKATGNAPPRFAGVLRCVEVVVVVIVAVVIDGHVDPPRHRSRRLDPGDPQAIRRPRKCVGHIGPGQAIVAGNVKKSIVSPCIE